VDDFDDIGTWYLYECGMDVPVLSEIMKKCPIAFDKNDDEHIITEKLTSFFFQKQITSCVVNESDYYCSL